MQKEQNIQMIYQIIKSAVFGHAIGDALGVPIEFTNREQLEKYPVTDMLEFGTHHLPKGTWSDDTSMMLCTLISLTKQKDIIPEDIMSNFLKWAVDGEFTPFGQAFGIGRTTLKAISNYRQAKPYGCTLERDNGNGSLMRILPVVLYQHFYTRENIFLEQKIKEIHTVSALTHAHERSMMACGIYSFIMEELLQNPSHFSIIKGLRNAKKFYYNSSEYTSFLRLFSDCFFQTNSQDIRSSGYVIDTLEAAIWSLLTTNSYESCVLRAVNLGGDTDTIAAVSGGLAGILYGIESIPIKWSCVLIQHENLDAMCMAAAKSWYK